MGADEEGTLAQLRTCRQELIAPGVAAHHGHIVKTSGDGMLVSFGPYRTVETGYRTVNGL